MTCGGARGALVRNANCSLDVRKALSLSVGLIAAGVTSPPGSALAQVVVAPAPATQQPTSDDESNNNGSDFARPLNLFQLMYQYRTAPGVGDQNGAIRNVTTGTVNLRVDGRFDLSSQWVLATRADLPFLAKDPISSSNASGDYVAGVGDADAQAALIYTFNERWKAGFGLRLVAPTGDDLLGGGKWRAMPIVGARYAWPELSPGSYLEPLVRYDESFAGDPTRRSIGNLQIAPTLNIGLPDRWFFTLYPSPDIRVNYSDPVTNQTGRLFIPFDARIGRKVNDSLTVSLEVGVPIIRDYPVYNFKSQLRLNMTF